MRFAALREQNRRVIEDVDGSTLISYESPEAIRRKCLYVLEKGLLGIMYWEHGCDPERVLLDVMYKTMNA